MLFGSIWIALLLFVVGEAGKRRLLAGGSAAWAWPVWALGALACLAHILTAFYGTYHASHDAMVTATARQTAAVIGLAWGGGVYVNYVFVGMWIAEVVWWGVEPRQYLSRPATLTWIARGFYLLVLVNALIVFVGSQRRVAGLVLVLSLGWLWRPLNQLSKVPS